MSLLIYARIKVKNHFQLNLFFFLFVASEILKEALSLGVFSPLPGVEDNEVTTGQDPGASPEILILGHLRKLILFKGSRNMTPRRVHTPSSQAAVSNESCGGRQTPRCCHPSAQRWLYSFD